MRMGELGSGEDPPALRFSGWHLGLWLTPVPFIDTTARQGHMVALGGEGARSETETVIKSFFTHSQEVILGAQ